MFPDACENCGLETDELTDRIHYKKPNLNWFICKHCEGKLYQHEFYPRTDFKELCIDCDKKFENDIHC